MIFDTKKTTAMRRTALTFNQRCEKYDVSMTKIELVTGIKRKNKKDHKNRNPDKIFPAYIWADPGSIKERAFMVFRFFV